MATRRLPRWQLSTASYAKKYPLHIYRRAPAILSPVDCPEERTPANRGCPSGPGATTAERNMLNIWWGCIHIYTAFVYTAFLGKAPERRAQILSLRSRPPNWEAWKHGFKRRAIPIDGRQVPWTSHAARRRRASRRIRPRFFAVGRIRLHWRLCRERRSIAWWSVGRRMPASKRPLKAADRKGKQAGLEFCRLIEGEANKPAAVAAAQSAGLAAVAMEGDAPASAGVPVIPWNKPAQVRSSAKSPVVGVSDGVFPGLPQGRHLRAARPICRVDSNRSEFC